MFLEKIVALKQQEVAKRKIQSSLEEMKNKISDLHPPRDFIGAIRQSFPMGLIAEIKKASPSVGEIQRKADIQEIAKQYEMGGACAMSVLTEARFFQGNLEDLAKAKNTVSLPILQKDFLIDPFQIYEGRIAGADACLLIAAILKRRELWGFTELAERLGLTVLVEVHDEEDLKKVSGLDIALIGINNRNLKTLEVDFGTTFRLIQKIPEGVMVVSESGIKNRSDVIMLKEAGIKGILVGETLMRAANPAAKIQELIT